MPPGGGVWFQPEDVIQFDGASAGVYEGTLGTWYSHTQKLCSDAGFDLTETFLPQVVDSYYLVVPHNFVEEGAYGLDYDYSRAPLRIERPQPGAAADRCVIPQLLTPCP